MISALCIYRVLFVFLEKSVHKRETDKRTLIEILNHYPKLATI